jgi:hypothetical protein
VRCLLHLEGATTFMLQATLSGANTHAAGLMMAMRLLAQAARMLVCRGWDEGQRCRGKDRRGQQQQQRAGDDAFHKPGKLGSPEPHVGTRIGQRERNCNAGRARAFDFLEGRLLPSPTGCDYLPTMGADV